MRSQPFNEHHSLSVFDEIVIDIYDEEVFHQIPRLISFQSVYRVELDKVIQANGLSYFPKNQ
jgi:hypothetical protein